MCRYLAIGIYSTNQVMQLFSGAMGVIDAVMGSDDQHRSVVEKSWREGYEYFRVEPQLVCHDGESIQVSDLPDKKY